MMYQERMPHRHADNDCGCGEKAQTETRCTGTPWGVYDRPIAIVYAPVQAFDRIYDLDTALMKGTVFEELDLPFVCGDYKKGTGGGCHDR